MKLTLYDKEYNEIPDNTATINAKIGDKTVTFKCVFPNIFNKRDINLNNMYKEINYYLDEDYNNNKIDLSNDIINDNLIVDKESDNS